MAHLSRTIAAAGLALGALATAARAEDAKTDISIVVGATSLTFSSLYVAQSAGLFAKEGLNVSIRTVDGAATINALVGGSVDFGLPSGVPVLRAVAKGQKLTVIANVVDRPMVELVLRKDVAAGAGITDKMSLAERGKALRGKTIGIQGVGSIIDAMVRVVARTGGLDPDRDMKIAPMMPPAMYPALKAQQLDGYATSLPWTTQAVLAGDTVDYVSGPGGGLPDYTPFGYALLTTRPDYCPQHADICRKMIRAFAASNKLIKEHPDEGLRLVKQTFSKMDPKLLEAAWALTVQAHPADVAVREQELTNCQKYDIDAGLLAPGDALKSFAGLYTNDYQK